MKAIKICAGHCATRWGQLRQSRDGTLVGRTNTIDDRVSTSSVPSAATGKHRAPIDAHEMDVTTSSLPLALPRRHRAPIDARSDGRLDFLFALF